MNPSQLIAWLLCLVLAFFAAALALHSSYKGALLTRRFETVEKAALDQIEVLSEVRDLLGQIERHMRDRPAADEPSADEPPQPHQPDVPGPPGAQ